jgi:hypothetical protein
MYPSYSENTDTDISSAKGLDITRSILIIDGNHDKLRTEFPHLEHQNRLGKEKSCIKCHHISLPKDQSTPCSSCHRRMIQPTKIFNHTGHTVWVAKNEQINGLHPQNHTCTICHIYATAKTSQNSKACIECHKKDMNIVATKNLSHKFLYANGYMDAMHKLCVTCHNNQKIAVNNPNLNNCSNCHKSLSIDHKTKRIASRSEKGYNEIVTKINTK